MQGNQIEKSVSEAFEVKKRSIFEYIGNFLREVGRKIVFPSVIVVIAGIIGKKVALKLKSIENNWIWFLGFEILAVIILWLCFGKFIKEDLSSDEEDE